MTSTLTRKRPGHYVSSDGRFSVTQFRDCSAGRGASVPRGWTVVDDTTGKLTHEATLARVREYLAAATR